MSSQRGNVSRTRKQKHTNSISFKNNKQGDTPKTKVLNSLQVRWNILIWFTLILKCVFWIQICNVCAHCQGILEWKIKYNKYKMLTAPAKCTKCLEKTVKQANTIMCLPCAGKLDVCDISSNFSFLIIYLRSIVCLGVCQVWEKGRDCGSSWPFCGRKSSDRC